MTPTTLRLFFGILTALAVSLLSTAPASAVPKLTPGSKRYCSCTCATQDSVLFYPLWEKRYACNLADNKKCTHKQGGTTTTGTLHSCMECEKTSDGGMLCVNPGLASKPPFQAPPGKLEQIMPRGIEGTQEIEPPPLESDEKTQ
ncbi:MAG TPA: hypothetical protein VFQ34_03205 [Nitrospiraceae bacterium]|jgi:hypothetical protein|nr:hypothetical protein [Nitrospiraceae bacterium]